MSRIKSRVNVCGETSCASIESLIDSGSDCTIIKESIAREIGLKPTGKNIHMAQVDGAKIKGSVYEGKLSIEGTCCDTKQEIVAIADDKFDGEALIGNDYMAQTGMKIDMDKKLGKEIRCNCSVTVEEIVKELNKLKNRL